MGLGELRQLLRMVGRKERDGMGGDDGEKEAVAGREEAGELNALDLRGTGDPLKIFI